MKYVRLSFYVFCLIAGVLALRFFISIFLLEAFRSGAALHRFTVVVMQIATLVLSYLPFGLLPIRCYIWFKEKSFLAPKSFRGYSFVAACCAVGAVALTIAGYIVLALMKLSSGLSGVPLGLLLIPCSFILGLVILIVEVRDWISYRRNSRDKFSKGSV
jgi:hypothetical protein